MDVNDIKANFDMDVNDVEEDVNMEVNEESETDPNFNMSNKEGAKGEDDETDECEISFDIGVYWMIVLPNEITYQPFKHNIIYMLYYSAHVMLWLWKMCIFCFGYV